MLRVGYGYPKILINQGLTGLSEPTRRGPARASEWGAGRVGGFTSREGPNNAKLLIYIDIIIPLNLPLTHL